MFAFKRKYLDNDLYFLTKPWFMRRYPNIVLGNYRSLHTLRNLLSPIGINGFILGYAFIVLLFLFQELLIGDPAARHFLLIMLTTHITYDFLLNMELLRLSRSAETEHYTMEPLVYADQLTCAERIQQLEQQGRWQEMKNIKTYAERQKLPGSESNDHIQWLGGFYIYQKGTTNCWLLRFTSDDYESYASRPKSRESDGCVLPVFQEIRDRGFSPQRSEQVLKRLERDGVQLQPCHGQQPTASPCALVQI